MAAPTSIVKGTTVLTEQMGSPSWAFAEGVKCSREWKGDYLTCLANFVLTGGQPTGTFGVQVNGAWLWVTNCSITCDRGLYPNAQGTLRIDYAGPDASKPVPTNTDDLDHQQVNQAIEKHPRYLPMFTAVVGGFENLKTYEYYKANPGGDDAARAAWLATDDLEAWVPGGAAGSGGISELLKKFRRGFTTYALWVPTYTQNINSWTEPESGALSPGGFIQTPTALPSPNYGSIYLPSGLVWLRCGDKRTFNGSYYTTIKKWIAGGDVGWDTDLYTTVT
jgi:hypothetical protein